MTSPRGIHPVLRDTKARFQPAIRDVLKTTRSHALDEAALPAYAHRNLLVNAVFWRRLSLAFAEAQRHAGRRALDFGCGTGLMSEALAIGGFQVTAIDTDLGPKRQLEGRLTFSQSITFVEGDLATMDLAPGSFDVIVALDVLEHVSPLAPYVNAFERLLGPAGVLIVSGPTENWLYRLGRRLAGKEFTGHYHVSNIHDVAESVSERFEVRTVARVIWPATLFEVLSCRRRSS